MSRNDPRALHGPARSCAARGDRDWEPAPDAKVTVAGSGRGRIPPHRQEPPSLSAALAVALDDELFQGMPADREADAVIAHPAMIEWLRKEHVAFLRLQRELDHWRETHPECAEWHADG